MRAYVEITTICNRSCTFCPGTKRPKVFVTPDVFAGRLEKLHGVDEVCLHVLGEPLLHPQFSEIAEICRKRGIPVMLTTNGTLLSPENVQTLLSVPIFRQINFSLQSLKPEETDLLDRILLFCKTALEKHPETYLNLRLWNLDQTMNELSANPAFLDRIFQYFQLNRPERFDLSPRRRSIHLKGRLYLNFSSLFEWPVHGRNKDAGPAYCLGLSEQIAVLADGSVVPCCLDSEGEMVLGNLDTQSLEEILSSPRAEAIRSGFRHRKAVESLCRQCTYRKRFTN